MTTNTNTHSHTTHRQPWPGTPHAKPASGFYYEGLAGVRQGLNALPHLALVVWLNLRWWCHRQRRRWVYRKQFHPAALSHSAAKTQNIIFSSTHSGKARVREIQMSVCVCVCVVWSSNLHDSCVNAECVLSNLSNLNF